MKKDTPRPNIPEVRNLTMHRLFSAISLLFLQSIAVFALEPDEILVIANKDVAASIQVAKYYCQQRKVPEDNVLTLSLGAGIRDTISRSDYERQLAEPIRKKLFSREQPGKIRCLLTTYGVPYKVEGRGPLKGQESKLKELNELAEQERKKLQQLEQDSQANSSAYKKSKLRLEFLQIDIGRISGKETNASVDSELSMALVGSYDLYRWQLNALRNNVFRLSSNTLMVSRLDGPNYIIVKGLIDKAISAEKTGLKGIAYIDSRGLKTKDLPAHFDKSLRVLATLIRSQTDLPVREETTEKLFPPGACPQTAIYCGWYSLKKYIDAFEFVDGAVGYHISSWEAIDLHDPNSSQWCPAMLVDGITATLGAVAEPYLYAFPQPSVFFLELFKGNCLVEAFYYTKPFNSWQLVLIGDPLYRPFKNSARKN